MCRFAQTYIIVLVVFLVANCGGQTPSGPGVSSNGSPAVAGPNLGELAAAKGPDGPGARNP